MIHVTLPGPHGSGKYFPVLPGRRVCIVALTLWLPTAGCGDDESGRSARSKHVDGGDSQADVSTPNGGSTARGGSTGGGVSVRGNGGAGGTPAKRPDASAAGFDGGSKDSSAPPVDAGGGRTPSPLAAPGTFDPGTQAPVSAGTLMLKLGGFATQPPACVHTTCIRGSFVH